MGKESIEYTPFKCPDCGVWWRGETHKCSKIDYKVTAETSTTNPFNPQIHNYPPDKNKNWIYCPRCGKNISKYDWHTCKKYGDMHDWKPKDNRDS